jgi:hypothetical protein
MDDFGAQSGSGPGVYVKNTKRIYQPEEVGGSLKSPEPLLGSRDSA